MNDEPRRQLKAILQKHGKSIIENPRRVENLLRDYCGGFRREISGLTAALEDQAVADLLAAASTVSRRAFLARLAQRLCDNLALSETAARWSIESWAWALELLTDDELTVSESEIENKKSGSEPSQNTISGLPVKQNASLNQTVSVRSPNAAVSKSVYIVSTNGEGNYASISEALRKVPANSRLLIREGLYQESIVIDKTVEIVGDGAPQKIIIRSASQSCISMQTEKAAVRGLTLQGRGKSGGEAFFAVDLSRGELLLENCRISSDSLSCVAIHGANAHPSLRNCTIHDSADSGIYIFDKARALIENCDLFRSTNDNLAITGGANPTVKNCRIFDGEKGGIVIWGNGATATIEDCTIKDHRLANVGVSQSANPVFRRCKIFGGRDTGVFVRLKGSGTFEECEIYAHQKAEVAVTEEGNSIFRRCLVHTGRESGVYLGNQANALVEGCNIYDNRDAGVALYGMSAASIRGTNIHRNGTVAVRITEESRARVEDCDLRGNALATWETEGRVSVERKNNRED